MSKEKVEQLVAEGKYNADGTRKSQCPTCKTVVGDVLTQEQFDTYAAAPEDGSAAATVETHVAETDAAKQSKERRR